MVLFIYSLLINKQMYVGSSVNVYNRLAHHKFLTKTSNTPLYKFIRENGGWSEVEINIHFYSTHLGKAEATAMEKIFVDVIKPSLNKNRMNVLLPKKEYDKQRYLSMKNVICPCCNKTMTSYNLKSHQKSKKYISYKTSSVLVF